MASRLTDIIRERQLPLAATVAWLASLILYTITLAPDVLAHDSGEWQAAAATLGISHSPGSPAYLLLGYLFTLAPMGTEAARVSFLSAVVGATGVAALLVFMRLLVDRWLPSVVAAASLALAGLWWSHASVATPYNVVPTLIVIMLILLWRWQRDGGVGNVYAGVLLTGVGLAYHPTIMYFIPVLLAGLFLLGPWRKLLQPRAAAITLFCLVIGLSPFIYLPVRSAADPPVKYAEIDSASSFFEYVTASEARETGHGRLAAPDLREIETQFLRVVRDGYYPSYAFLVFGPLVVLLYPAVWKVLRPERRFLLFLLAGAAAHLFIILSLSSIYAQYYLVMILYFSIWAGFSVYLYTIVVEALEVKRLGMLPVAILASIYLVFLGLGVQRVWPFVNHGEDTSMRDYVEAVYSKAGLEGVVAANWESYTGLLYARVVDGEREDLELVTVSQQHWQDELSLLAASEPGRKLLYSGTQPVVSGALFDIRPITLVTPVDIKGRTYQDYDHGEPYPAAVQLFSVSPARLPLQ